MSSSTPTMGKTQAPPMSLATLIRGVVVRSAIVLTPVTVMFFVSIFKIDNIPGLPANLEVSAFSMIGIVSVLYFQRKTLGVKSIVALLGAAAFLIAVAVMRIDYIPGLPYGLEISVLSMMGIVSIQYPFAVMVLKYYQKLAGKTEARIKEKLDALDQAGAAS